MLHRSVAGAVLLSICHFAAAEAVNTKPDKFNFWESEDLTWWSEESTEEETEKFLSAFSQGTPVLTNVEWDVAEQLINDLQEDLPKLKYGFINEGVESALLTFSSHHVSKFKNRRNKRVFNNFKFGTNYDKSRTRFKNIGCKPRGIRFSCSRNPDNT